jgi:hypothetical protein
MCAKCATKAKPTAAVPVEIVRDPKRTAARVDPDLFWFYVDKSGGPDACWPWSMYTDPSGYGRVRDGDVSEYTHRVAWEFTNGPIPRGMYICHHCDNPPCCNPAHLFMGTPADNARDRDAKGRSHAQRVRRAHLAQSVKVV